VLTQSVHSRNRDRAGDRRDRNLVLRIERVEPDGGAPAAVPGLAAARRTATAGAPTATAATSGPRTTTSTAEPDFLRPAAPARPATSTTSITSATPGASATSTTSAATPGLPTSRYRTRGA
jgi:hypothetical protein